MVKLRRSEMRIIDDAFDMHGGYVLDFSDRTFAEFFEDEFSIEIYTEKYAFNGSSKAKHLRAFVEVEDAFTISKVLRALWKYKESLPKHQIYSAEDPLEETKDVKTPLFDLLNRIEGGGIVPRTDALEQFKPDETLEELIAAIERDIQANKPAAALDRLHTYCMKKFSHLLDEKGVPCNRNDALHSRVGKYVKALENEHQIREISLRILKSSISIFEEYNNVRNNQSFAHDNDLVDTGEARFIFDSITSILRFVKTTEADKFGA
jgi:abortive infection Abi-like protein